MIISNFLKTLFCSHSLYLNLFNSVFVFSWSSLDFLLDMSGECVISSVLSCHNKNLKRWTSPWTDCVTALGQINVTAPCYSSVLFRK